MQSDAISVSLKRTAPPPRVTHGSRLATLLAGVLHMQSIFLEKNGIFVSLSLRQVLAELGLSRHGVGDGPGRPSPAFLFLSFLATQQYSKVSERGPEGGGAFH